jgi:hypothetical protein
MYESPGISRDSTLANCSNSRMNADSCRQYCVFCNDGFTYI